VTSWNAGTGTPMPYSVEIEGSNEVQPYLQTAPHGRLIGLSFPGHGGEAYIAPVGIAVVAEPYAIKLE